MRQRAPVPGLLVRYNGMEDSMKKMIDVRCRTLYNQVSKRDELRSYPENYPLVSTEEAKEN
jgi:hypothetical protein